MLATVGPGLPEDYDDQDEASKLPTCLKLTLRGHEGPVFGVRFNPAGTYALSCGKDRTVVLWNPISGTRVKTYEGHGYDVRDVVVFKDNSKFASCGGGRQVYLWDVGSARIIRKFRGHDNTVNAITSAAGDDILVTAGYDQSIKVWDCKSRSLDPIQSMKSFKDSVTSIAVMGWEITGGSVDGTVRRFDVRMGRCYIDDLQHPVTSISVTKDNMSVLAACLDSTLRLLDKGSGELLASYVGHAHQSVKMDCTLSPSDAHVVGSSETGEVLYWDMVEGTVVRRFQAHSGVVCSMSMHPKGEALLTSSVDGTVKVWAPKKEAEDEGAE